MAAVNSAKAEIDALTVRGYAADEGAVAVGIAGAADLRSAPDGFRPSEILDGCLSVIVLGVPFPRDALTGTSSSYTEVRNAMSVKMTDIAKRVAARIKKDGHKAIAVSSIGGKYIDGVHFGPISLKHAAVSAGLGVITKNYLLTSPLYGNRLWLSAVLTDAYLIPDEKAGYELCAGCSKCIDACPSGALNDPASFGKKECAGTSFKMIDKKWEIVCFRCRSVCPHCFGEL